MNYKDSLEGPDFPPNPRDRGDVASAIVPMENRETHCYGLSSCWEDMEAVMILPFFSCQSLVLSRAMKKSLEI